MCLLLIGCFPADGIILVADRPGAVPSEGDSFSVAVCTSPDGDSDFDRAAESAASEFCTSHDIDFNLCASQGSAPEDLTDAVEKTILSGANILFLCGESFAEPILRLAPKYSGIRFIAMDISKNDYLVSAVGEEYDFNPDNWNLHDYADLSNVYSFTYKEEVAGFLAGYAAASLGYTGLGFLGEADTPPIHRYGSGFFQGAEAAAEKNHANLKSVYSFGNLYADDNALQEELENWFESDIDLIFVCGKSLYAPAGEAASECEGKIICDGADRRAFFENNYGEGIIVTSAVKNADESVKSVLETIIDQNSWESLAGKSDRLGPVADGHSGNSYIMLPPRSTEFASLFTETDYLMLIEGIYNKTISVSDDTSVPFSIFSDRVPQAVPE